MYVDSEACIGLNGVESKRFKIYSGLWQRCVVSPWLFNLYMVGLMKKINGKGVRMIENGR